MMKKRIVVVGIVAASLVLSMLFFGFLILGSMRTFTGTSNMMEKGNLGYADSARYPNIGNYVPQGSGGTYPSAVQDEDSGYGMMYFQDYGTNVFIDASKDPLSTFGLDVDTASYTISKNYIMRGELPPTDAIRPEEFINYFSYDYPDPSGSFGVHVDITKSPFEDNHHILRIGIKSKEIDRTKAAKLTFVVDVSGSMATENRLALVKKSMTYLVNQLEETDSVAIVKYDTSASLVLPHTSVDDRQMIIDAIETLSTGGSTNVAAGLSLGYEQAKNAYDDEKINRLMLLSDGVANTGTVSVEQIIAEMKSYKEMGISMTAIGVGMGNYNDVLMERLADESDGNYAYVNDFNEAKRIFSQQLTGTLQIAGKDAKVQVEFYTDAVKSYRLIGYENRDLADSDFRNDSADAGEIGAGFEATALYELELHKETGDIAKVTLRYKDPDTGDAKEITKKATGVMSFVEADDGLKLAVSISRFAQILKLTAPPTSIGMVEDIVDSISEEGMTDPELLTVIGNAKRLIEIKQGE
jgi:Ca-activated chloride channel homolog